MKSHMYKGSFNYMSKLHFTVKGQEQDGWELFLLLQQISVFFGKMCLGHETSPLHGRGEYRVFPGLGEGRTLVSKKIQHTAEILEQFLTVFQSV